MIAACSFDRHSGILYYQERIWVPLNELLTTALIQNIHDDKMNLDSQNDALPNHAAWRQLAEGWDTIITDSTTRRFALPINLPRAIQKYLSRAHSVGKSSLGDSEPIDYSDLYPPEATDLQARLIDEAVCLGQGLGLEANAPTKSQVPISDTSTNSPRASQLNDPLKFDGTSSKFNTFATNLQLQFRSNPRTYNSEESKILYAGSYLEGSAYLWFQPHINPTTGDVAFTSFAAFMEALGAAFDDPDAYATAEREIESLRQEGSCASYYAQMVSVLSRLGWDVDSVKIHFFRKGLKENLKDALVGKSLPSTFLEFASACIVLDNELYARIREKKVKGIPYNFAHPKSDSSN